MEIEGQRIADAERQDLVPLLNDLVGHAGKITNSVADVIETAGSGNLAALGEGHTLRI